MILGTRTTGEDFHISDDTRARHVHIVGQTGTGKSALMANMIAADLAAGNGISLIDPHGELAEQVLGLVPRSRFSDVRYVVSDDRPVGINPLWGVPLERRTAAADEITAAFRSVWAWSELTAPRALPLLRNAIRTALDLPSPTFLDVLRIVSDGRGRSKATDPMNGWYWANLEAQDARTRQETVSPVITRLDALLTPPIRAVLCQHPRLDVRRAMDEGRILVCNLDKGKLGESNSHLLGAFIVSGIVQAAMNRSPQFHQRHFYLYVDEFQNFATDSFSTALSEARKKGLSITMTHQYVRQMPETLMSAVLGNTGTTVVFRVGAEDADLLAAHTGGWVGDYELAPRVLRELRNFECVARVLQDGSPQAQRLKTLPPPGPVHNRVDRLVRNSRIRFGRPRSLVEAGINQFLAPRPKARKLRKW